VRGELEFFGIKIINMLFFSPLNNMLGDKRLWRGPLPYVIIFFIICNVLVASRQQILARQRQQNLLIDTQDLHPSDTQVRWDKSIGDNLERYLPLIPDAAKSPLIILAGMSQMYAINDKKPGDKIIVEHLDDRLARHGIRAFGLAAPNMNNEEALLLLLAASAEKKTTPAFFVYGVCFDKFRNIDLRPNYQRYLSQNADLTLNWQAAATRYQSLFPHAADRMIASLAGDDSPAKNKNEVFEERLRAIIATFVPLVAARQDVNAAVMGELFELRNWVFNITPQSKRPILDSRYELNQEFLELIVAIAHERGIEPVFYVIPLNPLAENPYIPEQYKAFKEWLQTLCVNSKIACANFESVVPSEYWGEFMGGPDFKHFRAKGHELTARAIYNEFKSVFLKGRSSR